MRKLSVTHGFRSSASPLSRGSRAKGLNRKHTFGPQGGQESGQTASRHKAAPALTPDAVILTRVKRSTHEQTTMEVWPRNRTQDTVSLHKPAGSGERCLCT